MADFRQLALEFVLEEDETKLTNLAQAAASELRNAPANSNPVARWVEAVQPWMPGSHEDSESSTPDWPARAKALEFLSRTLDFTSPGLMRPSQVKLLIAFFGAMFDVDHKAGILASATALSRIVAMRAFSPSSGYDIIQKVCALKEDFQRQVAKTRIAVYELLRTLITGSKEVADDLRRRDGADAAFMVDVVELCQNERNRDCLFLWLDILRGFLQTYDNVSQDVVERVYEAFKAYYPISLLREATSGHTVEEMKVQLRKCFSSSHRLAPLAFPFLIGKLDQGDGVTVNVKLDVLKTIRACLEKYSNTEQAIVPYVDRLWNSLKYEVRNGEVEDTMWATLEVLKTLATRLKEDDLRNYTLNVTRDCVNDLSNPMYTALSGRLLVSVLSAGPSPFALMAAPAITHIKENLRRPASPTHSQDLLKLLFVILQARLLIADAPMTSQEKSDFAAVQGVFKSLYSDVYKARLEAACKGSAEYDDIIIAKEVVQGAGVLVSQRFASSLDSPSQAGLLFPGETCSQICQSLFAIILQSFTRETSGPKQDELINEAAKALHSAVQAYPQGFRPLVDQAVDLIRAARGTTIQRLGPLLGYVGCSDVSRDLAGGMHNFLLLVCVWTRELVASMDASVDAKVWCDLVAGIQSIARYFNDALPTDDVKLPQDLDSRWMSIADKYSLLKSVGYDSSVDVGAVVLDVSPLEARRDSLLISLYAVRHLYRRATSVYAHPRTARPALRLSDDFSGEESEQQYLHLLSGLGGFVVSQLSESQQASLRVDEYVMNLFHDEAISTPAALSEEQIILAIEGLAGGASNPWSWLIGERVNVLSFGLLEGLRASVVGRLFDNGVAYDLLIGGVLAAGDPSTRPVARSMLAILANKYKIEGVAPLMNLLNRQLVAADLEQASSVCAIASGMLRRYAGNQAQELLTTLRDAPNDAAVARRLETIVAPQECLTKEKLAVVKPLWMQRVYMELIKPMIPSAVGNPNFGSAVLLMVKHLPFSVYEDDAAALTRIAISIAQKGVSRETLAALQVLKSMLAEADTVREHVKSLVDICIRCFSPTSSQDVMNDKEVEVGCARLALEMMAALPSMLEARYLLSLAPRVRRELLLACGHPVRDVRTTARRGRTAWLEIK